eukprot:2243188-Pyramimonas_sp.AAC.1
MHPLNWVSAFTDDVHVDVVASSGSVVQDKRHRKEVPRCAPGQPIPSPMGPGPGEIVARAAGHRHQ